MVCYLSEALFHLYCTLLLIFHRFRTLQLIRGKSCKSQRQHIYYPLKTLKNLKEYIYFIVLFMLKVRSIWYTYIGHNINNDMYAFFIFHQLIYPGGKHLLVQSHAESCVTNWLWISIFRLCLYAPYARKECVIYLNGE